MTYEQAAASTEGSHDPLAHARAAKVQRGQDVLVYGATGAVGSAAVQLLRSLGANVRAVCDTDNVELVRGLAPTHKDQGPAVAGAVPGAAVGAEPVGAGVGGGALPVGVLVGKGVGAPVGDKVSLPVGKGAGAGREGPVPPVDSGAGVVDFFVVCGVVARGLGDGLFVLAGVGVVVTVGTGGSMR